MPEIIIKCDDKDVSEALQRVAKRIGNLSPIMKIIGERVILQTEERFNRQGPAPDGAPWASLSPATLKQKKHRKILTESGELRGSIHYQLRGANAIAIGTNKVYGAIQQLGGSIRHGARSQTLAFKKGGGFLSHAAASRRKTPVRVAFASIGAHETKIPARPFLGLSADNSAEIVGIINNYLSER